MYILKIFFLFIKTIINYLLFLIPKNIEKVNHSRSRIFLINFVIQIQDLILKKIKYPFAVLRLNNGEIYTKVGGIFLNTSCTFRYFKITSQVQFPNQGQGYKIFFDKTKKNIFLDLGSHIGEIAIFIAKNYPSCKVYSVEASPTCFKTQRKNIIINNVNNIKLKNVILSDKNSHEFISDDFGTENYSIDHPKKNFIKMRSIKLGKLIKDFNIDYIDFVKIDIEGSIPKLSDDLIEFWENDRIKFCALSIEKNSYESYEKIINSLTKNSKMYIFNPNYNLRKEISSSFLKKSLKKKLGNHYQSNRFRGMEIVFERYL